MKKFNIVLVSIFSILLGTLLSACNFKTPSATFTQDEIFISAGEEIDLKNYLTFSEISFDDVEFSFSSSTFFELNGSVIIPNTYGQANVYVRYNQNTLDSLHIVVRKQFEQVDNIQMDDDGLVTWNQVVDKFDETQSFVSPTQYQINITYTDPETNDESYFSRTVSENSYNLREDENYKEGKYTLSIYAIGEGYFDNSAPTTVVLYLGYMPQLQKTDFNFDAENGILSWAIVEGATFTVAIDSEYVTEVEVNEVDLSEYFDNLSAGEHIVIVTTNDENGEKISVASEEIVINKLSNAQVSYESGKYSVSFIDNASKVVLTAGEKEYTFTEEGETIFEGLGQGVYTLSVQTFADNIDAQDGVFYANSSVEIVGNIYKLGTLTLSGTGNNAENAETFSVNVSRQSENVATDFVVKLNGQTSTTSGFSAEGDNQNVVVENVAVGQNTLTISQIATQDEVVIENATYKVINSDESEEFSFTKLAAFEDISHGYTNGNSVISFSELENTTTYALYVKDGEDFELVENNYSFAEGVFTFNGQIETLFADYFNESDEITFKIVASGDSGTVISSSSEITLTQLSTPTATTESGAGEVFEWSAVTGAVTYTVRYAVLTKQQFNDENVDGLSFEIQTCSSNSITLESGNYYYIEVCANPANESKNLISKTLTAFFYLTGQLDVPKVEFMEGDLGNGSTYYIRVENVTYMSSFTVTLGGSEVNYSPTEGDSTIYTLSENFSAVNNEIILTVTANPEDSNLYSSSEYSLTIVRLSAPLYNDFVFNDLTTTLTVSGEEKTGVSSVVLTYSGTAESRSAEGLVAVMQVYDISSGSISAQFKGSVQVESVFTPSTDNYIYLDSATTTYGISRLDRPSSFAYNDGALTFALTSSTSDSENFVLDIFLTDANDTVTLLKVSNLTANGTATLTPYSVVNGELVSLQVGEQTIGSIMLGSNLLSNPSSNNYSIDISSILNSIGLNENLSVFYDQAIDVEFGIYRRSVTYTDGVFYLNSYYGSTLKDAEVDLLNVEKMPSTTLSYDKDNNSLIWEAATGNFGTTTYSIYLEGSQGIYRSGLTALEYALSLEMTASTDYVFYVVATNPYYLDSSQSNKITIRKLPSVSGVTLTGNNLQFTITGEDANYTASATVQVGSNTTTLQKTNNAFTYEGVTTSGTYTFKFVATTEYEDEGYYYLDSDEVTFTLTDMFVLKPDSTEVTFQSNRVSFSAFGGESGNFNPQTLIYFITFSDGTNTVVMSTNTNSCTVSGDNLSILDAGSITITVYAYLDTYTATVGGTIYFNGTTTAISSESLYNVYTYENAATVTKLAEPTVDSVTFDSETTTPTMTIEFSGNYSSTETVYVVVDETIIVQEQYTTLNGEIEIDYETYAQYMTAGESTYFYIYVASSTNITSNSTSFAVYANEKVTSVEHQTAQCDDITYYTNTLEISGNFEYATGGVVIVAYITTTSGTSTLSQIATVTDVGDTITVSLSEEIQNALSGGGEVYYQVFINSYSGNGQYFLASEITGSASYSVLTTLTDVNFTNGGFYVVDNNSSINSNSTLYIVEYYNDSVGNGQIVIGSDEDFYFEYPITWGNGTYTISIKAVEEGKVVSQIYSFSRTLQRLSTVSNVTLKRDSSTQSLSLSWDAVQNATSYNVRAYINENLVREVEVNEASVSVFEVLGDNYSLISGNYGISGVDITFEIIARNTDSSTYTDSPAFSFKAEFLGTTSALTSSSFGVDENGFLYFDGAVSGEYYLYRLVDNQSSGGVEFEYLEAQAGSDGRVYIDLTDFASNITSEIFFRVEVIRKGDATTDGVTFGSNNNTVLKLDSMAVTSTASTLFQLSSSVASAEIYDGDDSKIAISLETTSKVFVSLNDSYNPTDFASENIKELTLTDTGTSQSGYSIYTINYTEILDAFSEKMSGTVTLYFYALSTQESANLVSVISFAYSAFSVTITETTGIVAIEKYNQSGNDDLSETQLKFDYDTDIVGFYFSVDYVSESGVEVSYKYSYSIDDCTVVYNNSVAEYIILNLDAVLSYEYSITLDDQEISGVTSSGKYTIKVSILKNTASGVQFSQYITKFGENDLIFTKLPSPQTAYLSSGNLQWTLNSSSELLDNIDFYYIYFIDANNTANGTYFVVDKSNTTFNTENFSAGQNEYYVYVIAVAEDIFTVASDLTYVVDNNGSAKKVAKNRFNSELTLSSGGTLSIAWQSNADGSGDAETDFYTYITSASPTATNFVNNIFFYPFTFTVSDLVNGNVQVRFQFISYDSSGSVSGTKEVTVNAFYLLALLDDTIVETNLTTIQNALTSSSDKNLVTYFQNGLSTYCGGIASTNTIFDELFETVQEGGYEIRYCLLGNSSTFTSEWYTLTNSNSEKTIYVNGTPKVTAGYEDVSTVSVSATTSVTRQFYITINKSQVYTQNGEKIDATRYILQLRSTTGVKYAFEIYKTSSAATNWICAQNVEDAAQFTVVDNGTSLTLYLNLNNGESMKSKYADIVTAYTSFYFEVYAQGNEYSISSKSERFSLSFNDSCENFRAENGTLAWESTLRYDTTVIYKLDTSTAEQEETYSTVSGNFSLTLDQNGIYDYIKFITYGGVSDNSIMVDSDTYVITDLYKLATPTVSTDLNMIKIEDSSSNINAYNSAYTDDEFKKYEIYNDNSGVNNSYKLTNTDLSEATYYEAGMGANGSAYSSSSSSSGIAGYKQTEQNATIFTVTALGSTISNFVAEESSVGVYNLTIENSNGNDTILLRSSAQTINAKMLNSVDSFAIQNGVITWSSDNVCPEGYSLGNNVSLVFKVTVYFYSTSMSYYGEIVKDVLETTIVNYTNENEFDLTKIVSSFPTDNYDYIEVGVQAMALIVSATEPANALYVELIDGRYAYGSNISYNDTSVQILMSSGNTIDGIVLSEQVENVRVEDGVLTFDYSTNQNVVFVVEDENGNSISGTFSYTLNDDIYTYTFVEAAGALSAGEHTLTIYAIQTSTSTNLTKSAGTRIDITKIAAPTDNDYEISIETLYNVSSNRSVEVEVIDFSKYFDNNNYDGNTFTISLELQDAGGNTITITNSSSKQIVIFRSEDDVFDLSNGGSQNYNYSSTYIGYVVIEESEEFTIKTTATVLSGSEGINILYADVYTLDLSRPENVFIISYDSTTQTFSWTLENVAELSGYYYIVSITYEDNTTMTYYNLTDNTFTPTVIGTITEFGLTVKFSENALTSTYETMDMTNEIRFNLFESGDGTSSNPYIITTATQFMNIQYRMSKSTYLNSYQTSTGDVTLTGNDEVFNFSIANDINLGEISGILFKGEFNGRISGYSPTTPPTLTYTLVYSAQDCVLTSSITVSEGQVTGLNNSSSITFSNGLSLFEKLGSSSSISNLGLEPTFTSQTTIESHFLVAGLAIENEGVLNNINVNSFISNLEVFSQISAYVGAYAGIVAINRSSGSVTNSNVSSLELTGSRGGQYFYIGGIAYTNYGTISSSNVTEVSLILSGITGGMHQVAGICVTSTSNSSTLTNNTVGTVSVTSTAASNSDTVYIAGIAVYSSAPNYSANTVTSVTTSGNILTVYSSNSVYGGTGKSE